MEHIADPTKVLTAYKIINHQLAKEIQTKRGEIKLHEERYNATCEMLLRERQENRALRDVVRKLKDQIQIIATVIVSVQDQTVSVYDRINRPYEQAEAMLQNYTPRAQRVFERRRTENPPYVDEDAIPEEKEEEEHAKGTDVDPELSKNEDDTVANDESDGSKDDAEESFASNRSRRELRTSGAPLPMNSPLVQRLKRPSKNTSFDESFETIDCQRAFKLSRHSQDRRQTYVTIEENMTELQSVCNSSKMEVDGSEQLSETLRNLSPVIMDEDENLSRSSSTDGEQEEEEEGTNNENNGLPRLSDRYRSQLKKTVSESMLSRIHRTNDDDDDGGDGTTEDSTSREVNEMTVFNPAELIASCSTPVAKGCTNEGPATDDAVVVNNNIRSIPKTRPAARGRGRARKANSETELNKLLNPVVMVRPLTQKNVQVHERKMQPSRKAKPIGGSLKEYGDSIGNNNQHHHNSYDDSTENLSTMSGDSSRPRRRAAPKTLREPSLGTKLRRN